MPNRAFSKTKIVTLFLFLKKNIDIIRDITRSKEVNQDRVNFYSEGSRNNEMTCFQNRKVKPEHTYSLK